MINKAMQRKLDTGAARDVSGARRLGPYYVLDEFVEDVDYCDAAAERWIWSIARAERELRFEFDGVAHLVRPGQYLASVATDLYQADGLQCVWLR